MVPSFLHFFTVSEGLYLGYTQDAERQRGAPAPGQTEALSPQFGWKEGGGMEASPKDHSTRTIQQSPPFLSTQYTETPLSDPSTLNDVILPL